MDSLVFGQRLRYFRKRNGYTLTELGKLINRPAPYLSQLENGNSEPRVSLVGEIASILDCTPADLLDPEPPSRRAELEIDLRRLQEDPRNQERKLPYVRPSARMPDEVLEHIVGLYAALGEDTHVAPTEIDSVESVARNSNIHLRRDCLLYTSPSPRDS